MEVVGALRRVVVLVALGRGPGPFRFELDEPWRVARVVQNLAHARVPWVAVHGAPVDPDGGARGGGGGQLHLRL